MSQNHDVTDYVYEVDPVGTTTIDTKARSIGWEDE